MKEPTLTTDVKPDIVRQAVQERNRNSFINLMLSISGILLFLIIWQVLVSYQLVEQPLSVSAASDHQSLSVQVDESQPGWRGHRGEHLKLAPNCHERLPLSHRDWSSTGNADGMV